MNKSNQYAQSQTSGWRHYLVLVAGLGLFGLLIVRLVQLQLVQTEFLQDQSERRVVREYGIDAYRGMVTDRNGEPLAVSTRVNSVWLNPKLILEQNTDLAPLAQFLNLSAAELNTKVKNQAQKEFIYLQRHISPLKAEKISALKLQGVGLEQEYKRFYPAAEVTSHVVGFTNIDEQGIEGVELAYNDWLSGEQGKGRAIKDRLGMLVKDLGVVKAAESGQDITLSIDLRLQYQAYRELKAAVQQHGAKSGSLVMVDVESGEVLALVNQPAFNPNNRAELKPDAVRNRAVTDIFEPGSTVKPFTVAAALIAGTVEQNDIINTHPGYMRLGWKTIRDHRDYGKLSVTEILTKSSNIGVSKLALKMGGENLWGEYQKLGLGSPVGLGIPGESSGKIGVKTNKWSALETATLSYGYGLAVTPLQLAQAYQALANGGVKKPLTILQGNQQPAQRVMPADIANNVVTMLETVIGPGGTAKRGQVGGYRVAGKTGTVHKVGTDGYEDERYRSVFAGIAPADEPKVVTIVVIDEPSGREYYGGEVAAPVFARVMQSSLRLLSVQPNELESMVVHQGQAAPFALAADKTSSQMVGRL